MGKKKRKKKQQQAAESENVTSTPIEEAEQTNSIRPVNVGKKPMMGGDTPPASSTTERLGADKIGNTDSVNVGKKNQMGVPSAKIDIASIGKEKSPLPVMQAPIIKSESAVISTTAKAPESTPTEVSFFEKNKTAIIVASSVSAVVVVGAVIWKAKSSGQAQS